MPFISSSKKPQHPIIDFNFLEMETLDNRITFTRSSSGSYFNKSGVLVYGAVNEPRLDYDPSTTTSQGLLIEESRTNILTYSHDFDNAVWIKNQLIITSSGIAPDGSKVPLFIPNTSNTAHYLSRVGTSIPAAPNNTYSMSYFLKAREYSRFRIQAQYFNSGCFARFYLSGNGVIGDTGIKFGNGFTPIASNIQKLSDGWYRGSITFATSSEIANFSSTVYFENDAGAVTFSGNGIGGGYIWGGQVETGAFPTSYIRTSTTPYRRITDVALVNDISNFFNPLEGTVVSEANYLIDDAVSRGSTLFFDTNDNNRFSFYRQGTRTARIFQQPPNASVSLGSFNSGILKIAGAYKSNGLWAACYNGRNIVNVQFANPLPSIATIKFGNGVSNNDSACLNGHIRRMRYWPYRLPDSMLNYLTL